MPVGEKGREVEKGERVSVLDNGGREGGGERERERGGEGRGGRSERIGGKIATSALHA